MTLTYHKGDMFTSSAPAFAHGVNCDGVMGAGVALAVRKKWPEAYRTYRLLCGDGALSPGDCYTRVIDTITIFNLATQDRPGPYARTEWIESALELMAEDALNLGVDTVAMPKIGCGIGGLRWDNVEPLVLKIANLLNVEVWEL